jgi:hypothetical protein
VAATLHSAHPASHVFCFQDIEATRLELGRVECVAEEQWAAEGLLGVADFHAEALEGGLFEEASCGGGGGGGGTHGQ